MSILSLHQSGDLAREGLGWAGGMARTEKNYSQGDIDRAGKILSSPNATEEQTDQAIRVMDNWRLSHALPLEFARKNLEFRAKQISPAYTIGTRLKREESIRAKLLRESTMKLSTMQDIGGCRVVFRNMDEVERLACLYSNDPNIIKITDYVAKPRKSGYRGKHLIWKFKPEEPEHKGYDNMRIEIQVRTELQHSWATAIEVASTFTEQNLKSDHPHFKDPRWVRFFAVMGSVMAIDEGGGLVENTPTSQANLIQELRGLSDGLKVPEIMKRWNTATEITGEMGDDAHHFLIELQTFKHVSCKVNVTSYGKGHEEEAATERMRLENETRKKMGVQIALVGVRSIETLRSAYPNYFSDTSRFLETLDLALHGVRGGSLLTNITHNR